MPAERHEAERVGAVGYIRTSKGSQTLSPAAQLEAIETWCRSHDVELLEVFEDLDTSSQSKIEDRIALPVAIATVKRRRARWLIAAMGDRFHRSNSIGEDIRLMTAVAGGRIVTADGAETGENDGPTGWLINTLLGAISEFEVRILRHRVRVALKVRQRAGVRVGSVPFGKRELPGGTKGARKLVDSPDELRAIKLAGELRSDGLTYAQIGERLVEAGCKPRGAKARRDGRWHKESVRRLLHSEAKT
jgi:DNA invertase Pin-like site-specific DNA recombinase